MGYINSYIRSEVIQQTCVWLPIAKRSPCDLLQTELKWTATPKRCLRMPWKKQLSPPNKKAVIENFLDFGRNKSPKPPMDHPILPLMSLWRLHGNLSTNFSITNLTKRET